MKVTLLVLLQLLPLSLYGFYIPIKYPSRDYRLGIRAKERSYKNHQRTLLHDQIGLSTSNDDAGQRNSRRRNFGKALRRATSRVTLPFSMFRSKYKSLSKRGKRLFVSKLLILTVVLGSLGKRVYDKNYSSPSSQRAPVEVTYSSFMDLVEQQQQQQQDQQSASESTVEKTQISNVKIYPDRITYRIYKNDGSPLSEFNNGKNQQQKTQDEGQQEQPQQLRPIAAYTRKVHASPELIEFFRKNDLPFTAASQKRTNALSLTLRSLLLTFYCFFLWRMYRAMTSQTGNRDVPGKLATSSSLPMASFRDIQGIDEAKGEVMELVDTLRNPQKYSILGARAPTGLLLEGPPGTGKTMLARATAASAGVPLLYCSGSDFVEMFVGRGAARIRRLFERAQRLAPCIIFVDELDTLGRARDSGGMPGSASLRANDEAEQTLNQLLTCMDGLDSSRRICVLAATNRKDVLDPALIRPGRFDRIVSLKLPDAKGRENILRVHASKLPGFHEGSGIDLQRPGSLGKGRNVDLSAVAAITPGLSGAELEFIVNEAAIRAVRRVSAELMNEGNKKTPSKQIIPQVLPIDFEASVSNFYETRKKKNNAADIWKSVWSQ